MAVVIDEALVNVALKIQLETQFGRSCDTYGLTVTEAMVAWELRKGLSNKEISQRLGMAPQTIKNHITHINKKVGVVDRLQAVLALYGILERRFDG